jgi:hypothetical protein
MRKSVVYGVVVVAISVSLTLLGLEIAVRIHRGKVFQFQSRSAGPYSHGIGRIAYHPRLGWLPRPGQFNWGWSSNVDAASVRSNGRSIETVNRSRPILAVGDSFTFGDEVNDNETWAAILEEILNVRVLNAGVPAYGIDQAFLRAELLLDEYDPEAVILSFISDDINRTEYSYYPWGRGWKPYFEYQDSSLVLRNVPVPQEPAPPRSFPALRYALGYSDLADALLDRIATRWWHNLPLIERIHRDGESVSVDLLVRLNGLVKDRGGQFIAIALATNGRIGSNSRLPNLVKRASEKGVKVLDLSMEIQKLQANQQQEGLFTPGGHYSPAINRLVAERIAAILHEGTERSGERPENIVRR